MIDKTEKPFAPSCERNQEVIVDVLIRVLRDSDINILEVGSGTGQHAVYCGQNLPHITWHTSDVKTNHSGINMWLSETNLDNIKPPIEYEIGCHNFPDVVCDVVFCANTLHIINESLVQRLIKDLGEGLIAGNRVMFYGPFKYQDEFTSESNADFDLWLKDIDPLRGVRDYEVIVDLMNTQNFILIEDIPMPANNQLLVFEKL